MAADDVVRARIGEGLKQEFQDICPNMSQCLVAMINEYVEGQKDIYTRAIVTFLKKECAGTDEILTLGELTERICLIVSRGVYSLPEIIQALKKDIKISDELVILIYRDLLKGLYAGKDKEDLKAAAGRLHRNKERVIAYIQQKILERE